MLRGTEPVDEPEYLTDAFRREALAFIDRRVAGADPWFLYLAFNAVHAPLQGTAGISIAMRTSPTSDAVRTRR